MAIISSITNEDECIAQYAKGMNYANTQLLEVCATRWTSHFNSVNSITISLEPLLLALEDIYQSNGDLSAESGGILLALRDRETIITLFAAREILRPLFFVYTTATSDVRFW